MDGILDQLLLVAALVTLNALFAGSEIALISLREGQVRRLGEERGAAGRALAQLTENPNRFLSTIQIGITLAGFLASATAAVTLAEPLIEPLSVLGTAARPVAIVLVTVLLSYATLVIGELAPKRLAMQRAERWSLLVARPLAVMAALSRPAVWLLSHSTDLVVRVFGGDPARTGEDVTEEELRDLIAAQPDMTDHQREIMHGALEVAERRLRDVLVPRNAIVAFEADVPASEALDGLLAAGYSRAPVHRGTLDDVCGIVNLRDLVRASETVGDHAHEPLLLPELVSVLDALRTMQVQRQQMALVVSEYGGIDGLVTVEDLVEELVGEIYDQYDRDVRTVRRRPDGSYLLAGSFPVHDLVDLGIDLPRGDYTTISGLILEHRGDIPAAGDHVDVEGWRLVAVDVRRNTIRTVRAIPTGDEPSRR